jgi:hypothetical protein
MTIASNFVGWDFENVWGIDPEINNGRPVLRKFHDAFLSFIPVTNLTVPTIAWVDTPHTLNGIIVPFNATNNTITWSIVNTGSTGATLVGNTLNAAATGSVIVRATIVNGQSETTNYTQDFTIAVRQPVTGITGVPTRAAAQIPLTLTGTVVPSNSFSSVIQWSVVQSTPRNISGSIRNGNILHTSKAGTVTVRATVWNSGAGGNFTQDFSIAVSDAFIPVTNISRVPSSVNERVPLTLTGLISPSNATNQNINWEVVSAGSTGPTITGGTLNTTNSGTVVVRARIINGSSPTQDYTQNFTIDIKPVHRPVIRITGVPTRTHAGTPLPIVGTVIPVNATNQNISWSLEDAGGTGAVLDGSILNTTTAGIAIIRGTVDNGLTAALPFTQDFAVAVEPPLVPVTNITNVPTVVVAGSPLTLSGEVFPGDANNKTIAWSLVETGLTGATLNGTTLNTVHAGNILVRATIINGKSETEDYTQDFVISSHSSSVFIPITNITNLPTVATAQSSPIWLMGNVQPSNATNRTITWSIVHSSIGGINIIGGNTINSPNIACTIVLRATIENGTAPGVDYSQTFSIEVAPPFVPVVGLFSPPPSEIYAGEAVLLPRRTWPQNATVQGISSWTVLNHLTSPGITAEIIAGSILTTSAEHTGTITIMARVIGGGQWRQDYTEMFTITVHSPFVPVEEIIDVPKTAVVGVPLPITGTVIPINATNRNVEWVVHDAGSTGATILNGVLSTNDTGTVRIRAAIASGLGVGNMYYQEFNILVEEPHVAVDNISDVLEIVIVDEPTVLSGIIHPIDATNQIISWSVLGANSTGAEINGNLLTTTSEGLFTVRASVQGGLTHRSDYIQDFAIISAFPATVENIELDIYDTELLVGEEISMTATVLPIDAENKTINWSSSDNNIATVDQNGRVTGISRGIATITVSTPDNRVSSSATLTVLAPFVPVEDIFGVTDEFDIGNILALPVDTVLPHNATNQMVEWNVLHDFDTGASIINNTLSTHNAGQLVVRATVEDGLGEGVGFTQDFVITAIGNDILMERLELNTRFAELEPQMEIQLLAIINPFDATNQALEWTSDNHAAATVDAFGLVTAHSVGIANITVTSLENPGISDSCMVRVVEKIIVPCEWCDEYSCKCPDSLEITAPIFEPVIVGYARPAAKPIIITNNVSDDVDILGVTISGNSFEIIGVGSMVPAHESISTWLIQPKAGLTAGEYSAVITVEYDGGEATIEVFFTVNVPITAPCDDCDKYPCGCVIVIPKREIGRVQNEVIIMLVGDTLEINPAFPRMNANTIIEWVSGNKKSWNCKWNATGNAAEI